MGKKLSAPAKMPKGGTGGMRTEKPSQTDRFLQGPPASEAPSAADLNASETYGEHGESSNGSESDAGLMENGRKARVHHGRGFGSTLMKNVTKADNE